MDKTVCFLDTLPSDSLKLTLNQEPFFQKQHSDYWSIEGMAIVDYDLFICTGGSARFRQGGHCAILKEGEAFLAKPSTPIYAEHLGDEYFTAMAQHFDLKVFGELDLFSLITYSPFRKLSDRDYVFAQLERYRKLSSAEGNRQKSHSLFYTILTEFLYDSYESESTEERENYSFIFQMLSYIHSHRCDGDVLDQALKLSPYSHDYTSRVFRKRVGLPPKQFIQKSRLTLSRSLLLQGLPIKETAYRCGFTDELYFSRLFRKQLGISPTEFRKQYGSEL